MLELKGIKKDYPAGGDTVHALKGVDLKFRSSEFVSILEPSGRGAPAASVTPKLNCYDYFHHKCPLEGAGRMLQL